MFYGTPSNLLLPGLARTMGEGWETARRRDDGNDWVTVRLGLPGMVRLAELDTSHFKGNAPGWAARLDRRSDVRPRRLVRAAAADPAAARHPPPLPGARRPAGHARSAWTSTPTAGWPASACRGTPSPETRGDHGRRGAS